MLRDTGEIWGGERYCKIKERASRVGRNVFESEKKKSIEKQVVNTSQG